MTILFSFLKNKAESNNSGSCNWKISASIDLDFAANLNGVTKKRLSLLLAFVYEIISTLSTWQDIPPSATRYFALKPSLAADLQNLSKIRDDVLECAVVT